MVLDPRFKLGYVDDRDSVLEDVTTQLSEIVSESDGEFADDSATTEKAPAAKKAQGFSKILSNSLSTSTLVGLSPQEKSS